MSYVCSLTPVAKKTSHHYKVIVKMEDREFLKICNLMFPEEELVARKITVVIMIHVPIAYLWQLGNIGHAITQDKKMQQS